MTDTISFSDATVALRSFARRYSDVLSGPPGDDAWERLVRKPDSHGHSALDMGMHAAAMMETLATALASLSTTDRPSVTLPGAPQVPAETPIPSVVERIAAASATSADALAARRSEDEDRAVQMGPVDATVGSLVSRVVKSAADHLRMAETAIQDAR